MAFCSHGFQEMEDELVGKGKVQVAVETRVELRKAVGPLREWPARGEAWQKWAEPPALPTCSSAFFWAQHGAQQLSVGGSLLGVWEYEELAWNFLFPPDQP